MASATVCVRLRVPSFAFAFLKWLRTVSSPTPSAFAVSCNVRPIEACRNTACSLGVRTALEPTRFTSSPTSLSKRTAAALAAIWSKPRACWVKLLPSTRGDQNPTTHRPPTGHKYPSRMPYFSPSSKGHRSIPIGSSILESSVHVKGARHVLAVMSPMGWPFVTNAAHSSSHP